jgi:aminomuconate-semialdehyde/2-hydroxymuconate-6-semialdehyde dehydrogenase
MRQAADGVRPVSFELGGKNAALVFADCDFDETIEGIARSTFLNTGQVCLCTERVYVERPIYARFVAALADAARAMRIGDPWAASTQLGPLISEEHREKVLGYMALAREEGAEVITGGGIPSHCEELGGWFIEPTVWTGLAQDSRCMQEEVFGPVCNVIPFDSEEEAIALANDSKYGLASAIWTSNLKRGHRVAAGIDVGLVWLNTWFLRDLRTPFGGSKLSGLGREGGQHSLDFYSELKNVCVKL